LPNIRLQIPEGVDAHDISRIMAGITLGRDLINTPAHDCSPDTLEDAARHLADTRSGHLQVIKGDALLTHNFPLIHAVGRAASDDVARAPRLIDLIWHPKGHDVKTLPQITLVGKGVTFDTGGLNIKPDSSMLLMKKDMGGAASVLACASMIMDAELPVRLRVLIPAVENAISGQAFRPGDVLPSRKGLSVEIGNTDAEGRLILADTLTYADEGNPDLIIDMATLTGAARVALGPDLPPLMCDDDDLAQTLSRIGSTQNDPVWRLPLWTPYESMLNSKVADINNVSSSSYAGSILAALFLRKFISVERKWVHFDIFGWTPTAKPARPEGGEVQVARLVYAYVKAHLNS
jgi:leucyl aminopeptidase